MQANLGHFCPAEVGLAEPITSLLIDMLRLTFGGPAPEAWERTTGLLLRICGGDTERAARQIEGELARFVRQLREEVTAVPPEVPSVLWRIVDYAGRGGIAAIHPQYEQGSYLDTLVGNVATFLSECLSGKSWVEALDEFEGLMSIPIMSVHKSKGLEYHTVLFVGLEDSALWGYSRDPQEETCAFFVALSRARKRAIFTVCDSRPGRWGNPEAQSTDTIRPLYGLLGRAGIQIERIGTPSTAGTRQAAIPPW